ncbi:hypothetical protein HPB47_013649 [Ixodes persulcatus]|uniref:Uncharacterized protein n=1 Tax=Ixodes persulcatus TaxID=34615 RepID=A0AC60R1I2_IXOPE|nr:hypothetical protein HPB47_013649 [Ixodes persulcatus]
MSSKWTKYRVVSKEYAEILTELGCSQRTVDPSPKSANDKRRRSEAFTDDACSGESGQESSAIAAHPDEDSQPTESGPGDDEATSANSSSDDCDEQCCNDDSVTSDSSTQPSGDSAQGGGDFVSDEASSGDYPQHKLSAAEEFAVIAGKHNLTHTSMNAILDFCRRRGISELPRDARTVMKTERKAKLDSSGTFIHFGLAEGIREALGPGPVPQELKLQGNIDGLPLFKSSQLGLWPILCRITNVPASEPFMVSVYCGVGKPPSLQKYLERFLEDVAKLASNGMVHKGAHVDVKLTAMICDAPARSYVKAIIGHNGYHACERCSQKGQRIDGRQTFPDLYAPERTNASFRRYDDERHHTGVSPFMSLDIDMVTWFPTEYMHLVCLGVMRRLLKNWVCPGYSKRLSRVLRSHLNEGLRQSAAFSQVTSRGNQGAPRSWIDGRRLILLKHVVTPEQYEHFLMFHVAIRILVSPKHHLVFNQFARDLLRYFVQEFGKLYGARQLVYNVHTLSHLADQCLDHGPLDSFSAFPFESYLGKIKKKLRSSNNPLAQLSRRISEVRHSTHIQTKAVRHQVKPGDCFMLSESPVVVLKILGDSFEGGILPNPRNFFRVPLKSSELGIWRCDSFKLEAKIWPLADLRNAAQCVKLDYKQGHVVLPLLHLL